MPKPENSGVRMVVKGRVQKVGFRWFTVRWARDIDLAGYVKNLEDGSVLVETEGRKNRIESLIKELKAGPWGSHVDSLDVDWLPFEHRFRDFEIRY